jgi:hypothetical protein
VFVTCADLKFDGNGNLGVAVISHRSTNALVMGIALNPDRCIDQGFFISRAQARIYKTAQIELKRNASKIDLNRCKTLVERFSPIFHVEVPDAHKNRTTGRLCTKNGHRRSRSNLKNSKNAKNHGLVPMVHAYTDTFPKAITNTYA